MREMVLFTVLLAVMLLSLPVLAGATEGTTGGIQPVDPSKLVEKVETLGDAAYGAGGAVADSMARLTLGLAGLVLFLFIVLGSGIVRHVAGAIMAVICGLGLYYGAPYIVGMIKYFTGWLAS